MCNAWNHPPGCDCGWGGSGTGGRGGGFRSTYDFPTLSSRKIQSSQLKSYSNHCSNGYYKRNSSAIAENAETYPTKCWWCGAPVYYHSNGYGDSVLFDSLGHPWQIHDCWKDYWQEEKARREVSKPVVHGYEDPNQLKLLVLAGVIQKLRKDDFKVTEAQVATYMGISVKQLRQGYSHIYELYLEDKVELVRLK